MRRNSWLSQICKIERAGLQAKQDGKAESDNPYPTRDEHGNHYGGQLQCLRAKAWNRGWNYTGEIIK